MTLYDFVKMCTESYFDVEIWHVDEGRVIWLSKADEIPPRIGELEVESFDAPDGNASLTINVSGELEEYENE